MGHPISRALAPLVLACCLAGCSADRPLNPSFPLTVQRAEGELKDMRREPRPLERPVVVLGGWLDPGLVTGSLSRDLRRLTGDGRVIGVEFLTSDSFDACRRRVIERVERAFPSDDPTWTAEVDVIAVSMGGVVARHAAAPVGGEPGGKRLRIARLFTLASPHRGAKLAALPTLNKLQIDMRAGSPMLTRLDEAWRREPYPVYAYVRLGDAIVGEAGAAGPDGRLWWAANPPWQGAHLGVYQDPRFRADIARRLRGEVGYASEPAAAAP